MSRAEDSTSDANELRSWFQQSKYIVSICPHMSFRYVNPPEHAISCHELCVWLQTLRASSALIVIA